ncbi:hypothetical protein CYQ93_21075 [Acinetobacter baumannii]|nr:hypothetical protein CYQ93_21640 [Acinetobacter baumannii]RIL13219.1 hypothetical protein CYQ93_21075 [Acinetobacter baumannii]
MNKNVVAFSISVSVILLAFLIWCVFGLLFKYWGDVAAIKDSLSTISGIFGGLTTLGTAVVAAHLFNDWRDQHNKSVFNEYARKVLDSYDRLSISILDFQLKHSDLEADLFPFLVSIQLQDKTYEEEYQSKIEIIKGNANTIKTNFKFFIRNLKHYHLLIEESKSSEIKIKVLEDSFEKITDITNYSMIPTNELAEFNNLCGKAYEEYFRLQNLIDDNEIYKILKSLKV